MDLYVFLSFRQIHVVVYGTTSNYLTFRINFIIFVRTPCMNRARTKLLITLGKIVIFYLSVVPWSRTKIYKLRVQKEKVVMFASHPHMVGLARHQAGMHAVLYFHFQVGPQLSKPTIGKPPPCPPHDG